MNRVVVGIVLAAFATPAFAAVVPEIDGGLGLTVAAVMLGIGAFVYERFFRN